MSRVMITVLAIIGALSVGFAAWNAADWLANSVSLVDTGAPVENDSNDAEAGEEGADNSVPRAGDSDESGEVSDN